MRRKSKRVSKEEEEEDRETERERARETDHWLLVSNPNACYGKCMRARDSVQVSQASLSKPGTGPYAQSLLAARVCRAGTRRQQLADTCPLTSGTAILPAMLLVASRKHIFCTVAMFTFVFPVVLPSHSANRLKAIL